jgi:tetratricopeptide (TPR) repeat protein
MPALQDAYDEAMLAFSRGEYDDAIARLRAILDVDPTHFDAQLSIGMAYYRKGDYAAAIAEGHKAEALRPREQLVHTNLSLFYMKSVDKQTAEHHGLQARIASWKDNLQPPVPADKTTTADDDELRLAGPKPQAVKLPTRFPETPWKKKQGPAGKPEKKQPES